MPARLEPSCPAPPANVDGVAACPLALAELPASVVAAGAVAKVLPPTTTVDVPAMAYPDVVYPDIVYPEEEPKLKALDIAEEVAVVVMPGA